MQDIGKQAICTIMQYNQETAVWVRDQFVTGAVTSLRTSDFQGGEKFKNHVNLEYDC